MSEASMSTNDPRAKLFDLHTDHIHTQDCYAHGCAIASWQTDLREASMTDKPVGTPLIAWDDDTALRGPDAPKWDGRIEHLIRYLLTVHKRFGNTTVTADLQLGATALWKRDEQKDRIAELELANAELARQLASYAPHEYYAKQREDAIRKQADDHETIAKLEHNLAEERAIVNRIWALFGNPSYDELKGRSIYDLILEERAKREAAEKRWEWIFPRISGTEYRRIGLIYSEPSEIGPQIDHIVKAIASNAAIGKGAQIVGKKGAAMPDITDKQLSELAANEGNPLVRAMARELIRVRPMAARWNDACIDPLGYAHLFTLLASKGTVEQLNLMADRIGVSRRNAIAKGLGSGPRPALQGADATPAEAVTEAMKSQKPEHTHRLEAAKHVRHTMDPNWYCPTHGERRCRICLNILAAGVKP